ncbi:MULTISPECIES: chemotaxis protein CheB [unclassified Sphingomonas]|jgi:two-component system, chemotaxis family, protein-glutamate methylesterase/glutaminase|uniref:chemotaxis protein CheB n=1 Tax=unclassified Sphingomonas TaxID=196159 RepID=UPI000E108C3D|nr:MULTISPECIES: chemotaxis protein CheB [unclassified Sphingomonas]AXJ95034.1 chemotaxis response regulator protein-glutamate methylesterase [Sphingomonas sp. FARSPH]
MAAATKVLVVDDSLTMRALLSGALERIPNVVVVGSADGADEARAMVESLRPDVMTLDVEMPGMSGLEYLAEIMEKRPMPVIMFSTRTEAGAEASIEALRLGAIDCFPKPKVAVAAEFDKILAKLGKRIKAAKGAMVRSGAKVKAPVAPPLDWNGRLLAIGGEAASTNTMFDLFATFPANCPPTIVVQHLGGGLAATLIDKMAAEIAPRIVLAEDGMPVEQGTIYLAAPGDAHVVVDAWPNGRLRMLPRDPVAGERPSISILFASVAKACGTEAIGLLLGADGEDGDAGVRALQAGGSYSIVPAENRAEGFTLQRKLATQPVPLDKLSANILKLCSR